MRREFSRLCFVIQHFNGYSSYVYLPYLNKRLFRLIMTLILNDIVAWLEWRVNNASRKFYVWQ